MKVSFQPNYAQSHYLKHRHKRNIILKSRQLGFSTLKCIEALDFVLHNKNKSAILIAHKKEDASMLFDEKVKYAWYNLPQCVKDLYYTRSDAERILSFGFDGKKSTEFSKIIVDNSARSGTYNMMHISELSYLDKQMPERADEVITGGLPAVPSGGYIDIESTARGAGGHFYEMFMSSYGREPKTDQDWKCFFFGWWYEAHEIQKILSYSDTLKKNILDEIPEDVSKYLDGLKKNFTDEHRIFYYQKLKTLSFNWDAMKQEYPSTPDEAFCFSGVRVYQPMDIENQLVISPMQVVDGVKVYKPYESGNKYSLGVDVGGGGGRDSSAVVVWNLTSLEVVCTWNDNEITPDKLGYKIYDIAMMYGGKERPPMIAIEKNYQGQAPIAVLKNELRYRSDRLYRHKNQYDVRSQPSNQYGWNTDVASKTKMHYELSGSLNSVSIYDKNILSEMRGYMQDDMSKKSSDTKHYDLLTACAIGFQMMHERYGAPINVY